MWRKLLLCMVLASATVFLFAVDVVGFDRGDFDRDISGYLDRDVLGYNVLAERMFKGVVANEGHVIEGLTYLPLRMADSILDVQIGPKEFVERTGFKFKTGDIVTVIGMPVLVKGRQLVLARLVRSTNGVLVVRDQVGLPLWETDPWFFREKRMRSCAG